MRRHGIILLLCLFPSMASAQQKEPVDYLEAAWKRIANTHADFELKGTEQPDSDRVILYWGQIRDACVKEFDTTLKIARAKREVDEFAEAFVKRFGTEGPRADIRWAFACSPVLFIGRGGASPEYADLVVPFSNHLVNACLASPAYYQRLYWFRMWAGDPRNRKTANGNVLDVVGTEISLYRDTINTPPGSGSYEFAVTRFLMVAYLCNWESNFSDFRSPGSPAYFRGKFAQFESDYDRGVTTLTFDSKKYRFKPAGMSLLSGWLSAKRLPIFNAPPIPFPDAKPFPPIPRPEPTEQGDAWYWFRD